MSFCPQCSQRSRVMESRNRKGVMTRRRVCTACKNKWTTYEVACLPREIELRPLVALQDELAGALRTLRRLNTEFVEQINTIRRE